MKITEEPRFFKKKRSSESPTELARAIHLLNSESPSKHIRFAYLNWLG